ncbi:MAG: sulfite exporter TauE/SafE family protein [Candidatus Rokubacteria bacterium]|nr:sulfite exporter TauE/SafE family protein [Candidatus Rokubacteria bacterium]
MTALLVTVLGSSLLGSLHCAGMCGGFVALHSGAATSCRRSRSAVLAHGAYSGGRLVAYALLGGGAGALGGALDLAGASGGIHRLAALVAGFFIVVWGVAGLAEALGLRLPLPGSPRALGRVLGRGMELAGKWPVPARALVTGLLAALLPCGWLWAFIVTAAGTGSAAAGALVMAVFWAGTLPMLAGVGVLLETGVGRLRRQLPAATAVAMILVGLLAVAGRGGSAAPHTAHVPAAPAAAHGPASHAGR